MYYVYCITTKSNRDNDVYKIGYTKNLQTRKNDFDKSSTNLENWYYIDTITVSNEYIARKLEKKIHDVFSSYRIKNERELFKIKDVNKILDLFKSIKNMKIEKIQDGVISRIGESISNLIKTIELYGENLAWIITEKIDNAKAAHANNMWIKIEDEGKTIVYKDDGDGFTGANLKQFARNDRYHFNDDGAGIWGIGGKDSDRANSDYKNSESGYSKITYTSSPDGKVENKMVWRICEAKKEYENPEVFTNIIPDSGKCHKGTIIKHEDIHKITKEKWADAKKYIRFTCSLYDMNIYMSKWFTGHNAYEQLTGFFDPLYTKTVDLNKEGIFTHNDGSCHKIIKKTFSNYETGKKIKIKVVSLYFTPERLKQLSEIEEEFGTSREWAGVYFIYMNRYLSKPLSLKNQHAYNRTRIGVFLEDDETAKTFNIRSVKNQGINYEDNYQLKNYIDENGNDFNNFINTEINYWVRFDDKQRDIKNTENLGFIDATKKTAETLLDFNGTVVADVTDADSFEKIDTKEKQTKHSSEIHKEDVNKLNEAKQNFESLSDELKNDLHTRYQYCVSFGSFQLKRGPHLKYTQLKNFDDEIEIMPWSIHNYVLSGENEIRRVFSYFKNKAKNNSSTIKENLNRYIEIAYDFSTQ